MEKNIDKYLTPYKYEKPVLTGTGKEGDFDSIAVDCPFVFYHNNKFYMLYVGFDGIGYQTGIAISSNLTDWERKGVVLKREEHSNWDKVGAAGNWILKDTNNLRDLPTIKKIEGKYWMMYHSYPKEGYESGAAQMGLAWCSDEELLNWTRLKEPVFSWKDGDKWDSGGLYKPCFFEHKGKYYLFYNAKNKTDRNWFEQIGIAISDDMIHWERYKNNPVLSVRKGKWDSRFCSDPYVLYDENKWVMYYFGYDGRHAQEGIAFSENLFDWDRYTKPIIKSGKSGEIDENHAHKPSILYHNDTLYHFYCATRKHKKDDVTKSLYNEFRTITVATSKPI